MVALLRLFGWLGFTAGMAFLFLVLLDYGPGRFAEGLQQESERVVSAVRRRANAVQARVREATDQKPEGRTQAR